jgi:hypothetical protein
MVPPASLCFDCVPHLILFPFCRLIAVFGLALWALNCTVLAVRSRLEVLLPATLRSTVITRFIATMMALTPARHLLRGVLPHGSPVFTARSLPDIRPPTTPTFFTTGSVSPVVIWCANASGLRLSLAGSPFCCGRIVFTFVVVYQVLFVALHPASRRRSYFKFSPGTRFPMAEVFHLGGS